MKLIKSLMFTGAVALTLGTLQANAQSFPELPFSTSSQFEPVTFNLTVSTQNAYDHVVNTNTGAQVSSIKTEKLNSQDIIHAFELANGTNYAAGAKLAFDLKAWEFCIVDKTGTNVVQNCYDGVDNTAATNQCYLWINYDASTSDEIYVQAGKTVSTPKTGGTLTSLFQVPIAFRWEQAGAEQIDLYFSGLDTDVLKVTADKTATETDNITAITGDGSVGGNNAEVGGTVSGSGSWKAIAE